ncbi:hypothetical protein Pmani_027298 [Petrolisthes manimaculis]|uniref:Uncharacterized protein n=1 Tax=Petrolisthes manimaculis TaxID=1843537 RepID=A0AAE1TZ84_9EUCA|nr:hypothetical protein Pmani_027298 [Petrolisthes manimaculis]
MVRWKDEKRKEGGKRREGRRSDVPLSLAVGGGGVWAAWERLESLRLLRQVFCEVRCSRTACQDAHWGETLRLPPLSVSSLSAHTPQAAFTETRGSRTHAARDSDGVKATPSVFCITLRTARYTGFEAPPVSCSVIFLLIIIISVSHTSTITNSYRHSNSKTPSVNFIVIITASTITRGDNSDETVSPSFSVLKAFLSSHLTPDRSGVCWINDDFFHFLSRRNTAL